MQDKFYLTEKLPPYIFASIHKLKNEAMESGIEVLDFGMGNPDSAPPKHVMEKLSELTKDPTLFGYSATGGITVLKKAICNYYKRRFQVDLDYKTQSLITIGAKEGISSLATAICDSERHIVVPSPAYPIHTFAFEISKGNLVQLNSLNGADFLLKFKDHVKDCVKKEVKKPLAVIISYPCNPTTEIVGIDFYEDLVAFCKEHRIYIISDIAYSELYFNEEDKPHSVLEVEGAEDLAIEFSSVSKSYSMAGCRVGFAVGNRNLIAALYKIKSYLDYGSFSPLQMAAADALSEKSDEYLDELRIKYKSRGEFLAKVFKEELNWDISKPKASMFVWTKLPKEFNHLSSFEFCKKMILEAGVAMSPGSSFGKNGEGYVRLSLIHNEENVRKAATKMKCVFNT